MPLKAFVSYAKEDQLAALKYYDMLAAEGVTPWIDCRRLLPGQNWAAEIERAFKDANIVVLLLSKRSVNKRGFVQREANDAIEQLRYKQPADIYVIPLLLEPCDVPSQIAGRLQYVDLAIPGSWDQVRASLKLAASQQAIEDNAGVKCGKFRVFSERIEEKWEGLPGYDITIEYPRFESAAHSVSALEMTELFAGRARKAVMDSRQLPWDQSPDTYPRFDGDQPSSGRWDSFGLVHATDRLMSLTCFEEGFSVGAAHGYVAYETFTFCLLERLHRMQLADFFDLNTDAASVLSTLSIEMLKRAHWERFGELPDEAEIQQFKAGAGPDFNNFRAFTVEADSFTFLFPPYQVASYAAGRWSVKIPFYDLLKVLRKNGPHTLAAYEPAPDD